MRAIRPIASAAILLLAGCAAPVPDLLGDASRPLMAPGQGLVAGSVSFKTREPDFKRYGLIYTASYVPANQVKGFFSDYAFSIASKGVQAQGLVKAPNETPPILMLMPVKAGKYKIAQIGVLGDVSMSFFPKNPREIEVIVGQVTYVGADVIEYTTSYKGVGVLTPHVNTPFTRNDFERDMAGLKAVDQRLEAIPATNALTR